MAALSDMGGRAEHFGPVAQEPEEPVFHEPWEGRVFGMTVYVNTLLGPPNVDAARFEMEKLPPEIYMSSYYRRWLGGLESSLADSGHLAPAEIDARVHGRPAQPAARRASAVRRALRIESPADVHAPEASSLVQRPRRSVCDRKLATRHSAGGASRSGIGSASVSIRLRGTRASRAT